MYCIDCGTVNPENAQCCLKCGRDLKRPQDQAKTEVDIALAARAPGEVQKAPAGLLTTRLLSIAAIAAIAIMVPIGYMTMQLRTALPVLTRSAAPAIDEGPGLGLAPAERPEVIAGDVARKANAGKARVALEQHYAEYGAYPESLEALDPRTLGFVPNAETYAYQLLRDGRDYRLEVVLQSHVVSGADIVKEGDLTKLVITGAGN